MIELIKNRIHNAELEFNFNNLGLQELREDKFVDWAKEYVLDSIDYHSKKLVGENEMILIPELKIELNLHLKGGFFKNNTSLKSIIDQQIEAGLKNSISKNESTKISTTQYKATIVLDFIKNGYVKKDYSLEEWNHLISVTLEEFFENRTLKSQFLFVLQKKNPFLMFFEMMNPVQLKYFFVHWTKEEKVVLWIQDVQRLLSANPNYFIKASPEEIFYSLFVSMLSSNKTDVVLALPRIIRQFRISSNRDKKNVVIPPNLSKEIIEMAHKAEFLSDNPITTEITSQDSLSDNSEEILENDTIGAYVGQAGLVLLAPYLPQFLKNTGYLSENDTLLNPREIPILLHYLATGEKKATQWKLTLPKILAGLRLGEHCSTKIRVSKKLNIQIKELLQSIVEHWPALKNTSPEGLRETFLVRDGQLKKKNGFYYLYIKEKTVDILLSSVPWNYTTIKLNWMKKILFVEWHYN